MIAVDSQGHFVKGISTDHEVSMLESRSSLVLQGSLRGMQILVRAIKYTFIDSSPSPGGKCLRGEIKFLETVLSYVDDHKSRPFGQIIHSVSSPGYFSVLKIANFLQLRKVIYVYYKHLEK